MNPQNNQQSGQVGAPRTDHNRYGRSISPPPRDYTSSHRAASDVVRGQLENIYNNDPAYTYHSSPHTATTVSPHSTPPINTSTAQSSPASQPTDRTEPAQNHQTQHTTDQDQSQQTSQSASHGFRTTPPSSASVEQQNAANLSPYQRTMSSGLTQSQQSVEDQWKQYHTAWQQYYQQYYQRYYLSNAYNRQQTESSQSVSTVAAISNQANVAESTEHESISQKDAMQELRDSIRQKITTSTDKIRKSRHFIPAIAGISVLLLLIILQYNRVIVGTVAAYVSPGNIDPQNIIVDPSSSVEVGPEPKMIIPKINVDAPVIYGVGADHDSQMAAMENGIAHFSIPGANAVPGQIGNTVMAAHSSNDVFAPGDYKFVFAQNEKLVEGDIIYMHYEGVRYTYSITSKEVVLPTEVSKIQLDTDKPMLTLISCVPLGTAQKRLLVFAEQISPSPSGAQAAAPEADTDTLKKNMPGQPSPTLIERIFGAS